MTTAPREIIAHSQFDDETRELMIRVYDHLQREFGMDADTALIVVDRILALADGGERSAKALIDKAAPTASRGVEQDTEPGTGGS
jgi:hypothetical protein